MPQRQAEKKPMWSITPSCDALTRYPASFASERSPIACVAASFLVSLRRSSKRLSFCPWVVGCSPCVTDLGNRTCGMSAPHERYQVSVGGQFILCVGYLPESTLGA